MPALADLVHTGHAVSARRVELDELLDLAADPPADIEPGGTTRVVLAVLDVARRSVAAGLVHPHLQAADGRWHALWGATLDEHLLDELHALAHAAPAAAADAFDGEHAPSSTTSTHAPSTSSPAVRSASGRQFPAATARASGATERFLAGLAASSPELPAETGYAALERRVAAWVDGGLARRSRAPWNLGLRLDEGAAQAEGTRRRSFSSYGSRRPTIPRSPSRSAARDQGRRGVRVPAGQRPAPRARSPARDHRAGPRGCGDRARGRPADAGRARRRQVRAFLRDAMPRLEALGVPLRLPRDWVSSSSRVPINLVATGSTAVSGGTSRDAIASFDWRVAIGDVELSEEELRELAAAKEPLIRLRGKWHALRASEVERALRFLERRGRSAGSSSSSAPCRGSRRTRPVSSSAMSGSMRPSTTCSRSRPAAVPAARTPAGMRHDLFPFQERGHGWLRLLGDLRVGGILADDMGLGKTVQAIATLVSEREDEAEDVGPTLVVSPMSVSQQWAAARSPVSCSCSSTSTMGPRASRATRSSRPRAGATSSSRRTTSPRGTSSCSRGSSGTGSSSTRRRTRRTRARSAIMRCGGSRGGAHSRSRGTPIENRLGELWAIMDLVNPGLLGSREAFERSFARPIEVRRDALALERLRSLVGPFVLRRAKDAPRSISSSRRSRSRRSRAT